MDEAALVEVTRQLRPRVLLLMNLFRDQLDRYGELEHLAALWARMVAELPASAVPVLNADDPAISALGAGRHGVLTFGIDDPSVALTALPHAADSTRCRLCSHPLTYDLVTLGHLGHWRCEGCGAARVSPDVRATRVTLRGAHGDRRAHRDARRARSRRSCRCRGCTTPTTPPRPPPPRSPWASRRTPSPAAWPPARPRSGGASGSRSTAGELVLLLAKNPTGANETVRTVLLDPEPPHLLIALNDRTADGHDVSWIWDVDYEPLLARAASLTLTGDRAHDLALRMRYAGHPGGPR